MVGLTALRDDIRLPLAGWGAGTRRLSALTVAEQNEGLAPVTVVDELERGLEPYRQRTLVQRLREKGSQAFATTHSPFVIGAGDGAAFWFVDHKGTIGPLDGKKIERTRAGDPAVFLSRLAVIAEGATEVGFVTGLLERALGVPLHTHGIHVSDGGSNETTLELLEALLDGGLQLAGFADNENKYPTRWQGVAHKLGPLLFRWPSGCTEQNVITAVPVATLEQLLTHPNDDHITGSRLRTLADRLGIADKSFAELSSSAPDLHALIIEAATGHVPPDKAVNRSERREYQKHARVWFKSTTGGRELQDKLFDLGLWRQLAAQLLPFCNAGTWCNRRVSGYGSGIVSDETVHAALRSGAPLVVIEAPAGCGKTHQGAEYAREVATERSPGRPLILTHTHAACSVFAARTKGTCTPV